VDLSSTYRLSTAPWPSARYELLLHARSHSSHQPPKGDNIVLTNIIVQLADYDWFKALRQVLIILGLRMPNEFEYLRERVSVLFSYPSQFC